MVDNTGNFEKAVDAYRESCEQKQLTFQQPSQEHSNMIHDVMYLRIRPSSYVARYDTRRQRVLA